MGSSTKVPSVEYSRRRSVGVTIDRRLLPNTMGLSAAHPQAIAAQPKRNVASRFILVYFDRKTGESFGK